MNLIVCYSDEGMNFYILFPDHLILNGTILMVLKSYFRCQLLDINE